MPRAAENASCFGSAPLRKRRKFNILKMLSWRLIVLTNIKQNNSVFDFSTVLDIEEINK
jgi:hypothetical protein